MLESQFIFMNRIFMNLIFINLFFGTNSDVNHRLFTDILSFVPCTS